MPHEHRHLCPHACMCTCLCSAILPYPPRACKRLRRKHVWPNELLLLMAPALLHACVRASPLDGSWPPTCMCGRTLAAPLRSLVESERFVERERRTRPPPRAWQAPPQLLDLLAAAAALRRCVESGARLCRHEQASSSGAAHLGLGCSDLSRCLPC